PRKLRGQVGQAIPERIAQAAGKLFRDLLDFDDWGCSHVRHSFARSESAGPGDTETSQREAQERLNRQRRQSRSDIAANQIKANRASYLKPYSPGLATPSSFRPSSQGPDKLP